MRRLTSALLLSAIACTVAACGDSSFAGSSGKKNGVDEADGSTSDGSADGSKQGSKGDDGLPANPTKEQAAIGKCLQAWGDGNPFGASAFKNYRKVNAAVSVLGGGGYAIEDTEVTDEPKLILISATVSVLGETNYQLMNPNGWYCMMVDVNVLSKTNVELQCKAKLADTRVNVNVLGKSASTAAVGVNVLSDVTVTRMKNAGANDACN